VVAVTALSARGLTVRFGGHLAVNGVDLDVEEGTITGLIGPNGAGKTTIFNALCGMQELVSGRVLLDDKDVTSLATHQRARLGLARTFQRLELFGSLTTRENLQVAAEYRTHLDDGEGGDPEQRVRDALEYVRLESIADRRADTLSTGQARLVELARALVTRPSVLLLDEPASGLDADETSDLTEILRGLADSGVAILVVEHDMPLVMSTCSVIYVIDFGSLLAVGSPAEIRSNQMVLDAYLGSSEARS
jgi:branched-chain amino acid transport system ATP-binding protein